MCIRKHTLRVTAERLEQVCCLADRSLGFLKHIKKEAEFAQKTNLANACGGSVLEGEISDDGSKVHNLKEGIGVRV